jgi:hypothetical protein
MRVHSLSSRAWTSIVEGISAIGEYLPPLVILKGKSLQRQWYAVNRRPFDGCKFVTPDKGWTNIGVGVEWLKVIFIQYQCGLEGIGYVADTSVKVVDEPPVGQAGPEIRQPHQEHPPEWLQFIHQTYLEVLERVQP